MCGYIFVKQCYCQTEMALSPELYGTPASRLDSFVAQWLQPNREWKEEVLEAVRSVEQFLRAETFQGEDGLDQEVQVLKVVKVRLVFSSPAPGLGKPRRVLILLLRLLGTSCFHIPSPDC